MTVEEKQRWLNIETMNLFVSKEYYHHHSFEIINAYEELKNNFLASLSNEIKVKSCIRK